MFILYFTILGLYGYNILLYVNDDLCTPGWVNQFWKSRILLGRFLLFLAMIVGSIVFSYRFQHIKSISISAGVWSHHLLFLAGLMVQNRTKDIKMINDIIDDLRCLTAPIIRLYDRMVKTGI